MSFGLDYVSGPSIAAMKAHVPPVEFVCRYTGYFSGYDIARPDVPQGKVLTPGEAKALSEAGIALVSNWEWYANRVAEGAPAGAWDAHAADRIHRACGGPADRPIYFSVDEDVPGQAALGYFSGVISAIGLHRAGAYGSDRVLKYLFDSGMITYGWQTYAWSYGAWEPRAHIRQYSNSEILAGHEVDFNHSMQADFGQWFYGGGEVNVSIDIHTPGISTEFEEVDAHHWRSKRSGKIIQYGILDRYKSYGNAGLCGLSFLGHPISNEVPMGPGEVKQFFQFGVLHWKDNQVTPLALYDGGPGQDPRVAPLQAQAAKDQSDIAALTKQASDLQAQIAQQQTQIEQLQSAPVQSPETAQQVQDLQGLVNTYQGLLQQINPLAEQITTLAQVHT